MSGQLELVRSFRLKRGDDETDRSTRVERTELFLALERITAWWPPQRDLEGGDTNPGYKALTSLLGGDTIVVDRVIRLMEYLSNGVDYYRFKMIEPSPYEGWIAEMERAGDTFVEALNMLAEESRDILGAESR